MRRFTRPLVCSCRHLEAEHDEGGPCRQRDSYGQPCECPVFELDALASGQERDDAADDLADEHWGPQLGGRRLPDQ